jgi:arylformamidase
MIFNLENNLSIDTTKGFDISISLSNTEKNPLAWYVDFPKIEPVRSEHFTGSIAEGGPVNFRTIFFNPHGHGTHTECLGHITPEVYSVNQSLKSYFFKAFLITIEPQKVFNENYNCIDEIITLNQIKTCFHFMEYEALVIRTTPNLESKKSKNYSGVNHPYIEAAAADYLHDLNIRHLLIDLPSVDRESDDGKLAFHHAFWKVPESPQFEKTITELIYVDNNIKDGAYILNLQTAPFENDASPSRPVLFEIF